jgi:hypothetical protein
MLPQTNRTSISCSMLKGTGKQGILTPDKDGYYTQIVGAYGTDNSMGMHYDLASGLSMFKENSVLVRRMLKGVVYAEYKHPEPFMPDGKPMNDQQYLARIRKIDDDRRCAHIRRVYLLENQRDEKGRPCVYVMAEIRPCGPYGHVVKDSFENPHENTYFSVRSVTMDDITRGIKYTREIVTWDYVGEGGILGANKYNSPSLEDFTDRAIEITPTMLWSLADEQKRMRSLGLEHGGLDANDLINALGWSKHPARDVQKAPAFLRNW